MNAMSPATLTDSALLDALRSLVRKGNAIEAELIAHLAEVDARNLHLGHAHPSLFSFCTLELAFSESVAYNRIVVARAARRFPRVLDCLRDGSVHLTGLRILTPHLTVENHETLLAEAHGKSKRDVEALIARWFPKPDVPDLIRKLPAAKPPLTVPAPTPSPRVETAPASPSPSAPARPESAPLPLRPSESMRPATVEPLSAEHFKVQFTADRALNDKLQEARNLLRHQIPDGSLAAILDRALDLLLRDVRRKRFAEGRVEHGGPPRTSKSGSRHVPDAVKRAVFERDGGQCTFVDDRGHRCPERGWLELDHVHGFARDPTHTTAGIRLLCRAHNQHLAERLYGAAFMEQRRREGVRATPTGDAPP